MTAAELERVEELCDELGRRLAQEIQTCADICRGIVVEHGFAAARNLAALRTARRLNGGGLFTEQEILAAAVPKEELSGVYFLVRDGKVSYVGQSVNVFSRVATHQAGEKQFDAWTFVECPREQLEVVESLYIHAFRPPDNVNYPGGVFSGSELLRGLKADENFASKLFPENV